MRQELRFAAYAIRQNLRSQAEYRTSFLLNIVGMAINNTAFVLLWMYFARVSGNMGGWHPIDMIGMLAFSTFSFGIAFSIGDGLRRLPGRIADGIMDQYLLSPKNIIVRVATASFNTSAIGDLIFGLICFTIYFILISASLDQIIVALSLTLIATIFWFSVLILIGAISFYFTDATNVSNSLMELILTPSIFYGGAFQGAIRVIFTFIIPALIIGTLPLETIKNMTFRSGLIIITITLIWFIFSIFIFYRALRRYESANLMTFGKS